MSRCDERQLSAEVKRDDIKPVYLFYGEEGYLKRLYTDRLIKKAVTDLADFNLHRFDASVKADELASAVDALPMMSEKTCVVVRDYNFGSLSESDHKLLMSLITSPNESCVLIFYYDGAEAPPKNKKTTQVLDEIDRVGCIVNFERKNERELADIASRRAAKAKVVLNPSVARRLVDRCGTDLENLLTEVDKLCAYVGDRAITDEDVDAVVTRTIDASAFALANAVCSKRRDEAMLICADLFDLRAEPVMILGALSAAFVDIYRVKVGESEGLRAQQTADELNYGKSAFRLRNAAQNGRNMSRNAAFEALEILCEADLALKSTGADGRVVVERTIVQLLKTAAGDER